MAEGCFDSLMCANNCRQKFVKRNTCLILTVSIAQIQLEFITYIIRYETNEYVSIPNLIPNLLAMILRYSKKKVKFYFITFYPSDFSVSNFLCGWKASCHLRENRSRDTFSSRRRLVLACILVKKKFKKKVRSFVGRLTACHAQLHQINVNESNTSFDFEIPIDGHRFTAVFPPYEKRSVSQNEHLIQISILLP